ncbi:MAG: hypothetical protein IPN13_16970 [Bacteroidetes bacterium]|nr:hypothetical protein [Bacteroidota bacterium]
MKKNGIRGQLMAVIAGVRTEKETHSGRGCSGIGVYKSKITFRQVLAVHILPGFSSG